MRPRSRSAIKNATRQRPGWESFPLSRDGQARAKRNTQSIVAQDYHAAERAYLAATQRLTDAMKHLDFMEHEKAMIKAPLHPIRKMTPHLLGLVFRQCFDPLTRLNAPLPDTRDAIRSRQLQPFRLAAVCRYWRAASLASPRAWSIVEFNFDHVSAPYRAHWKTYLNNIVERSGRASLSLRITYSGRPWAYHHGFLDILTARMLPRCTQLFLQFAPSVSSNTKPYEWKVGDPRAMWMQNKTPRLRELHVRGLMGCPPSEDDDEGEDVLVPPTCFPYSPLLETFVTDCPFSDELNIPSLRTAILFSPPLEDLQLLRTVAPNLMNLLLDGPTITAEVHPQFSFDYVVSLALTLNELWDQDSNIENLARTIRYPSVRYLLLRGERDGGYTRTRYLSAALAESHLPLLEHVVIDAVTGVGTIPTLLGALTLCFTLRTLEITNTTLSSEDIKCLFATLGTQNAHIGDGSLWACPFLSTIKLSSCDVAEDADAKEQSLLALLVESRNATWNRKVERLTTFEPPGSLCTYVVDRIRAALGLGLRVSQLDDRERNAAYSLVNLRHEQV